MPFEVRLTKRPVGYALEDATGIEGQPVKVLTREFLSSEDSDLFISRLEGLPSYLLSLLAKPPNRVNIMPSSVNHFLAIIRKDLRTTIYVNELPIRLRIRSARAINVGEAVTNEDIADIDSLTFPGVEIERDAAVVCLFSCGWRKGLFFDLMPLASDSNERDYDLAKLLGYYYAYLANQIVFKLNASDWDEMIIQQWFPFISLPKSTINKMIGRVRAHQEVDILIEDIRNHVTELLPHMLQRWSESDLFKSHIELLLHAADKFREKDYVSATAIIYPRIEGLLRSLHITLGVREKVTQDVLTDRLIDARKREFHPHSWLLPAMFRRYLKESYFADFEPGSPIKISRHSVGHGVAEHTDFNEKAACIGFLVLDQIFFFLPAKPKLGT